MKISDDLTALIFELQRTTSAADKAKALARAWRTIRKLSPTERRLLVREVGFDGAEDLVEGLAGKGSGAFAPAAVLEALGKARRDKGLSVRSVLQDLRSPERREDFLVRGIDLLAGSVAEEPEEVEVPEAFSPPERLMPANREIEEEPAQSIESEPEIEELGAAKPKFDEVEQPPPQASVEKGADDPELHEEAAQHRMDETDTVIPSEEPSPWDSVGAAAEKTVVASPTTSTSRWRPDLSPIERPEVGASSVLHRLSSFRHQLDELQGASLETILDLLETLPEPWAQRRAVVALIQAGVLDDVPKALDLIDGIQRPMDRRWCLGTLAKRGSLAGEDLDRALAMLASPAARRRIAALASSAG